MLARADDSLCSVPSSWTCLRKWGPGAAGACQVRSNFTCINSANGAGPKPETFGRYYSHTGLIGLRVPFMQRLVFVLPITWQGWER